MAAPSRRKKAGHGAHNDERWLLTYSDMITLLMALFIIMWAISTVNDAKFNELAKSLSDAFSGKILAGNKSVLDGASSRGTIDPVQPAASMEAPRPHEQSASAAAAAAEAAARAEQESLAKLKEEVDAYAGARGLSGKIKTSIDERGLVIRIIPDDVLFDTGKADLKHEARPILDKLAGIIAGLNRDNPIRIEGNTDNVPISTDRYRNNWELSTARAVTVLTVLLDDGLDPTRLSAAGYADQRPVATNDTPEGRAENRRVEIVVVRKVTALAAGEPGAAAGESSAPLVDIQSEIFDTPQGGELP
jgi:chemotaxis protein MotB